MHIGPVYLYALGQMRAGAARSQRLAALAVMLMLGQLAAVLKMRLLLAVTPVGSCLSQVKVVPAGAAEGVITLTKSASTCTAHHTTPHHTTAQHNNSTAFESWASVRV